jgi:hypothetical protein
VVVVVRQEQTIVYRLRDHHAVARTQSSRDRSRSADHAESEHPKRGPRQILASGEPCRKVKYHRAGEERDGEVDDEWMKILRRCYATEVQQAAKINRHHSSGAYFGAGTRRALAIAAAEDFPIAESA